MPADAHGRSSNVDETPLYDLTVATLTHAERARTLVSALKTGTLCTLGTDPAGYPYGSFTTMAFDRGNPVFLLSALAEHTKNLMRDPRASLLVAESVAADPLANGRVTLLGKCTRLDANDGPSARDAYLALHPNANHYVDFTDFGFWKLGVESIRYIGGYGRMSWIPVDEWEAAEADPIAPLAARILKHMNDDHEQDMVVMCRGLTRATDTRSATMTSIDRLGFEMSAVTSYGPRPIRLGFDAPISTSADAREALVAMVHTARKRLALDS